jgi:hypothetical protein
VARVRRLTGDEVDSVPHGDTVARLLGRVAPEALQKIPLAMVRALLEARRLEKFRLLDRYYLLAADMSGHLYLGDRASAFTEGCLTQTAEDGPTLYYRPVCEAKLVTRTGLALSVGSEFVQNGPGPAQSDEQDKQDCEQKAMRRLLPRVKEAFPGLAFCLLADSLHCNEPTFRLCQIFECYCQGKSVVKHDFGSLRNLAHALLEAWRRDPVPEPERLRAFLDQPIQIRLDTS